MLLIQLTLLFVRRQPRRSWGRNTCELSIQGKIFFTNSKQYIFFKRVNQPVLKGRKFLQTDEIEVTCSTQWCNIFGFLPKLDMTLQLNQSSLTYWWSITKLIVSRAFIQNYTTNLTSCSGIVIAFNIFNLKTKKKQVMMDNNYKISTKRRDQRLINLIRNKKEHKAFKRLRRHLFNLFFYFVSYFCSWEEYENIIIQYSFLLVPSQRA